MTPVPPAGPRPYSTWPDLAAVWLLGLAWPTLVSVTSLLQGQKSILLTDSRIGFSLLIESASLGALALYWKSRGRLREVSAIAPSWAGLGHGFLLAMAAWISYYLVAWGMILVTANPGLFSAVRLINQVSLPAALLMSLVNPVFEELLVTGCVIRILEKQGAQVAVGTSVLFRLAYHLYQGPIAVASTLPVGFMFGAYFWKSRDVWPLILAHALLDFAALALLR